MQDSQFSNVTANQTFWVLGNGIAAAEGLVGVNATVFLESPRDEINGRYEEPARVPTPDAWPTTHLKPLQPDDRWFTNVREVCSLQVVHVN